jgi:hypothetical protein
MVARFAPAEGEDVPWNSLAWACAYAPGALADPARIVALAERAVEEGGREHHILDTLGAAYFRAGRFVEALRKLEEGLNLHGRGGVVEDWLFLAMIHRRLGHAAAAEEYLERASPQFARDRRDEPPEAADEDPSSTEAVLVRRALGREAEGLIRVGASPADPFAR